MAPPATCADPLWQFDWLSKPKRHFFPDRRRTDNNGAHSNLIAYWLVSVFITRWSEATKYSVIRGTQVLLPFLPFSTATSRNVGKLSVTSCSSFTAQPPHSAITLTKLPPNFYAHKTHHTQDADIQNFNSYITGDAGAKLQKKSYDLWIS